MTESARIARLIRILRRRAWERRIAEAKARALADLSGAIRREAA